MKLVLARLHYTASCFACQEHIVETSNHTPYVLRPGKVQSSPTYAHQKNASLQSLHTKNQLIRLLCNNTLGYWSVFKVVVFTATRQQHQHTANCKALQRSLPKPVAYWNVAVAGSNLTPQWHIRFIGKHAAKRLHRAQPTLQLKLVSFLTHTPQKPLTLKWNESSPHTWVLGPRLKSFPQKEENFWMGDIHIPYPNSLYGHGFEPRNLESKIESIHTQTHGPQKMEVIPKFMAPKSGIWNARWKS